MVFRATTATLFTIPVLIAVTLVVVFASRERALPFAYAGAAATAATSLTILISGSFALPAATRPLRGERSLRSRRCRRATAFTRGCSSSGSASR